MSAVLVHGVSHTLNPGRHHASWPDARRTRHPHPHPHPQDAHDTRAAHPEVRRPHRRAWPPRLAGTLTFCALALGTMLAANERCAPHHAAQRGNYSQSTLGAIRCAGMEAASFEPSDAQAPSGACECRHSSGTRPCGR
jgi:hypothetical protein